jgi:parallel beta-helix repeat protein
MTSGLGADKETTMFSSTIGQRAARLKFLATVVAILGADLTGWAGSAQPAQAAPHHTIIVPPGTGTISAAVAGAHAGDTIKLLAGTFFDSVFINVPLHISGAGATRTTIRPQATSHNPCNVEGVNGLCVSGPRDKHGNPERAKPLRGVTIDGLRVTGFTGSGVFGMNTDGLTVHDVWADRNDAYGIARFVSTRSTFAHNTASYNGEAGFYVGDSPNAQSVVIDNSADHNGFGVFLRDSTQVTASGNRVWGNCIGIFALNSGEGAPGDLPAGDYRITDNAAWANDKACPAGEHPPFSGVGIGVFGVHDSLVRNNTVIANQPSGASVGSGGIVLASTKASGGADPSNNSIYDNDLNENQPADIASDRTGHGNRISANLCSTTLPGDLGGCTGAVI